MVELNRAIELQSQIKQILFLSKCIKNFSAAQIGCIVTITFAIPAQVCILTVRSCVLLDCFCCGRLCRKSAFNPSHCGKTKQKAIIYNTFVFSFNIAHFFQHDQGKMTSLKIALLP